VRVSVIMKRQTPIVSDEPVRKKAKWINRQRVLIFATRGISHQHRHLMKDLEKLMPHSRHENKMERKENLYEVNEMCQLRNCNKCILFDGRLRRDLYMWVSCAPEGPSAKFLVESIYTSGELKLTGNCLTGSRPLISFDQSFLEHAHYSLLREMFVQVFGVPNNHPKSQPFFDHVITFSVVDNRIWYRNYQIISEDGALAEIGPRFVLNPVKIFAGSFCGSTIWENDKYVSPSMTRRMLLESKKNKYVNKKDQKITRKRNEIKNRHVEVSPDEIFDGTTTQAAKKQIAREIFKRESINKEGDKKDQKITRKRKEIKNRHTKDVRKN